jgi:hypothetical protein
MLGIVVYFKFRHGEVPPLWLRHVVSCVAIVSLALLFYIPGLPSLVSGLIISGTILCGLLGATWSICGITGAFFSKSFAVLALSLVPFILWIDLRFCVVVQDRDGRPVDPQMGSIELHRPNRSYFQSYIYGKGLRVKKGITYFGLLKWLQHKEEWIFSGAFFDKDGRTLGDLEWKPARWSEWPKVVITN